MENDKNAPILPEESSVTPKAPLSRLSFKSKNLVIILVAGAALIIVVILVAMFFIPQTSIYSNSSTNPKSQNSITPTPTTVEAREIDQNLNDIDNSLNAIDQATTNIESTIDSTSSF